MLTRFLQTLAESGSAQLSWPEDDVDAYLLQAGRDDADKHRADQLLADWHREALWDLPGPPLAHHKPAARWGAIMIFRAANFVCLRKARPETIATLLPDRPLPDADTPEAHFAADLSLRHWPALFRMARALSEDDPLVKAMYSLAGQIPLSAVGLHLGVSPGHVVLQHPGLRQFLAERALDRADHACLAVPEIQTLLRSKLGSHSAKLGHGLLPPLLPS